MTDTDRKLLLRFEADNKGLVRKLEQSQKKITQFEAASGRSITSVTNSFQRLGGPATNSINKFGNAANDSFAKARRGVGQLGFQVQDIAVQLQGGQNPLLVLSQQGSQVASIFGPGGAVIGAFVAVGAVLAGVLSPELSKAADRLFDFKSNSAKLEEGLAALDAQVKINSDGTLEYSQRIKDLAKVSKEAAEVELSIALIQAEANIKTATEGIVSSVSSIEQEYQRKLGSRSAIGKSEGIRQLRESLGLTAEQFKEFRGISTQFLANPTIENAVAFNAFANEVGLSNERFRDFITDLNTGVSALNNSETAIKKLDGVLSDLGSESALFGGGSSSQLGKSDAAGKAFESLRQSLLSEEESIRESYARRNDIIVSALLEGNVKIAEASEVSRRLTEEKNAALNALDEQRVLSSRSFVDQSLGIIQSGLEQESGLAKAAFAARQGLLIAETIMNTEAQARQVAKDVGGLAGEAAAVGIRALGYTSVGIIAGQTIASFEGGGMTPSGPRSGGMDGKGGMLAMLHPNEKVTDLTRASNDSGGWTINVNNTISDTARISQSVNERDRVIDIMVDQANNSNSRFGQAIQGRYQGLNPRGNR